ncbi:MAG TPA: DUF4169 family protein [Rhizomicrobium sp.]|jgi:hypothetical protein
MGEVVNLRRAKKAKARDTEEKSAAANRGIHGTPKRLREVAKAEKRRSEKLADAHKLEPDK